MRFLIDAQLPPGLARLFIQAGHEATHPADVAMLGEDDAKICEYAVRRCMIVVTKDADFMHLRRASTHAPRVIWVRLGNATNRALSANIQPQLKEVLAALAAGEEIVEIR